MSSSDFSSTVTGGELRGRKINSPRSLETHPMGARERLALFNMVMARRILEGAIILDAYAGTGALGIEALSRGARKVVFVEKSDRAIKCLSDNVKSLGVSGKTQIVKKDIRKYVPSQKFDVIMVDPPYNMFRQEDFLHLVEYLVDGGVFVVSHPENTEVGIRGLKVVADRKYAGAKIAVFVS